MPAGCSIPGSGSRKQGKKEGGLCALFYCRCDVASADVYRYFKAHSINLLTAQSF